MTPTAYAQCLNPSQFYRLQVYEETGYDITNLADPNTYIEGVLNYQHTRLYLIRNIPIETVFVPRTRKEIKCCEWFAVEHLPTHKTDPVSRNHLGINANSFFMIMPFVKQLKKWVGEQSNKSTGAPTATLDNPIEASPSSNRHHASSVANRFLAQNSAFAQYRHLKTQVNGFGDKNEPQPTQPQQQPPAACNDYDRRKKAFAKIPATNSTTNTVASTDVPHWQRLFNPPKLSSLLGTDQHISKWQNIRLNRDAIVHESTNVMGATRVAM